MAKAAKSSAPGAQDVAVEQPRVEQGAGDVGHAAGVMEVVHVARAVGIDAGDQRDRRRQGVEVGPVDEDARGARDRRDVDRVVGRAAGREQADRGIDDRALVDDVAERARLGRGEVGQAVDGGAGQRLAQRRAGIDEGGTGNVEPHQLHHHLVRIGGAVEGAGARAVVGSGLGGEQFLLADLAFGVELANALLFLVGEPRGHRPRGDEQGRQMAEAQRADQQPGDDLVADAEHGDGFEHAVAERDRGRQRDGVAAEQRQLHPRLALGHAVAHRRDAARDLRGGADLAREDLHLLGIAAVGLMRREHVVVGGDDADVRRAHAADRGLVLPRRGKAVREIAAAQPRAVDPALAFILDQREVALAARLRALDDAVGDRRDARVEGHGRQWMSIGWSHSASTRPIGSFDE